MDGYKISLLSLSACMASLHPGKLESTDRISGNNDGLEKFLESYDKSSETLILERLDLLSAANKNCYLFIRGSAKKIPGPWDNFCFELAKFKALTTIHLKHKALFRLDNQSTNLLIIAFKELSKLNTIHLIGSTFETTKPKQFLTKSELNQAKSIAIKLRFLGFECYEGEVWVRTVTNN